MKLPVIKHINRFEGEAKEEAIQYTIELLEHISESRAIKDEELDVLGELLSNLYGAQEVNKAIAGGKPERDALNEFMQRVMGSIDRS